MRFISGESRDTDILALFGLELSLHGAMVIRRRDAEAGADADAETQMTD